METSRNSRTELLAILTALSSPYSEVRDYGAAIEAMRDHLTDRDGGRDSDLHRAFQAVIDAIAVRQSVPLMPTAKDFARR